MADQIDTRYLALLNKLSGGNQATSDPLALLNIYNGLDRGGVSGYGGAALSAGNLYGNVTGQPVPGMGALGGALGLYNGIQQGGVTGDIGAALNGVQLAGALANSGALGSGAVGALGTGGSGALGLGGTGVMGAASAAALPVAGFIGLNALFNKQSQESPLSLYENAHRQSTDFGNAAQQVAGGDTGPNGVYQGYGVNQQQVAQALQDMSGMEGTFANAYLHMSPAQVNNDDSYSPPDLIGGPLGSPGGFGMGRTNGTIKPVAKGGHMKKLALMKKKYGGSIPHFDDGGGADMPTVDITDTALPTYSPPPMASLTDQQFQQALGTPDPNYLDQNAALGANVGNSGFMSPLLSSMGLSGMANSSNSQQLGVLAALAGLLGHSNVPNANWNPNQNAPPMFNSSHVAPGANQWGNFGITPRQQVNPNVNYATYGQGPEQQFFQPPPQPPSPLQQLLQQVQQQQAQTPQYQLPVNRPVMRRADGGEIGAAPGHAPHMGYYAGSQHGSYVKGPGDGTSDDVNAKLSDGEYVMDAGTVAMLGNGSNEAGARKLDQLRQRLRQHAGEKLKDGKQFMKAKDPTAYIGGKK